MMLPYMCNMHNTVWPPGADRNAPTHPQGLAARERGVHLLTHKRGHRRLVVEDLEAVPQRHVGRVVRAVCSHGLGGGDERDVLEGGAAGAHHVDVKVGGRGENRVQLNAKPAYSTRHADPNWGFIG